MTTSSITFTTLRSLLLGAIGLSLAACSGSVECEGCHSGGGGTDVGTGGNGSEDLIGRCTNPVEDGATGFVSCDEGYSHRPLAVDCPDRLPRSGTVDWPETSGFGGAGGAESVGYTTSANECSADKDCEPQEMCAVRQTNYQECPWLGIHPTPDYERVCMAGCVRDADCGEAEVCVCGQTIGFCQTISSIVGCRTDADCEGEALCLDDFACQLPGDDCYSDKDCESRDTCEMRTHGRTCSPPIVCGRPFLIHGAARIASLERIASREAVVGKPSGEGACDDPLVAQVSEEDRRTLAAHWTAIGLMEHASVAAFARFSLQLMSLGAPADLVEASAQAQLDESRHTRLAFDLANRYGREQVGPGRLAFSGALDDESWQQILVTTILEGCIGETRAALEASASAALCRDLHVAKALRTIAQDEGTHAELAWKTIAWMLEQRPDLQDLAGRTFLEGCAAQSDFDARPEHLEAHGVLNAASLHACTQQTTESVIMPCARELFARSGSRATSPRRSSTPSPDFQSVL